MGIDLNLGGFNMIVTVINYRAPGMRWSRLPMFVWSMFTVSFLQAGRAVLVGARDMASEGRTFQTAFFANQLGGSSFLDEDLFWFFGHPEVYILALPGFGVISEITRVCRRPLVRLQGLDRGHARGRPGVSSSSGNTTCSIVH